MLSKAEKRHKYTDEETHITVGIDPGKKGAIAILQDGDLAVYDLGDCYDDTGASKSSLNPSTFTALVLQAIPEIGQISVHIGCESPIFVGGGFTIRTPMSMFESFGAIRAVFGAFEYTSFFRVLPREWQKFYPDLYHPKVKRTKEESVNKAKELFPNNVGDFERVVAKGSHKGNIILLDGRAEASLIANYVHLNTTKLLKDTKEREISNG